MSAESLADQQFDKEMALARQLEAIDTELSQAPIPKAARQQELSRIRGLVLKHMERYQAK